MPRKSNGTANPIISRPMTRSRSGASTDSNNAASGDVKKESVDKTADITYYTKVKIPSSAKEKQSTPGFQVISKRELRRNDPTNLERLQEKLAKVREWEKKHKKRDSDPGYESDQKDNEPFVSSSTVIPSNPSKDKNGFGWVKLVININIFLYSTCYFIQSQTLPYLTKKLGADSIVFGQLQTAFALVQLTGGPLYGRLGDVLGTKTALIVAFASALASSAMMGFASSIHMLFFSRFVSIFMHVMQGSQMAVTQLSSDAERTKDLARLGFSFGLGMMVGPSLGGIVTTEYGEQSAALVAAFGSFISILLVILFIPNIPRTSTTSSKHASTSAADENNEVNATTTVSKSVNASPLSILNMFGILRILFSPQVVILLLIKLACGIPIGILHSMFSVIAIDHFGLAADETGVLSSYVGFIAMLMQGFGISLMTSRFSDKNLLRLSTTFLATSFIILTLVNDIQDFFLLLLPLTCSMTLIHCIITGCLTKVVHPSSTGQVLGLNMAIHSSIRAISPTIGGYLISTYGLTSLGGLGMISVLITFILLPFIKLRNQL